MSGCWLLVACCLLLVCWLLVAGWICGCLFNRFARGRGVIVVVFVVLVVFVVVVGVRLEEESLRSGKIVKLINCEIVMVCRRGRESLRFALRLCVKL